jgi:hypothetical protein
MTPDAHRDHWLWQCSPVAECLSPAGPICAYRSSHRSAPFARFVTRWRRCRRRRAPLADN